MSKESTSSKETPLDELRWRNDAWVVQNSGIHENSVLYYFQESPFFDRMSNNAVVFTQLHTTGDWATLGTRQAFQNRLKLMSGLEFLVVQEPEIMAAGFGTGVWVIRKQTRRKRPGQEDEIIPHASYFVVNDNIYMAPTLAGVLNARLVSPHDSPKTIPANTPLAVHVIKHE